MPELVRLPAGAPGANGTRPQEGAAQQAQWLIETETVKYHHMERHQNVRKKWGISCPRTGHQRQTITVMTNDHHMQGLTVASIGRNPVMMHLVPAETGGCSRS